MKLSVVVPAFNAARYIGEALESVLSQLPADDSEVIVVDDGSTDDTASLAESFASVRVIRAEHAGIATTINRAMSEARGELIASIDADDRWCPNKLALQFAALDADPSLEIVFGFVRQFLSPDVTDAARFTFTGEPMPGLHRGSMLVRRSTWTRVGPMDTTLTLGEFIGWYARALDLGVKTKMLSEVLYERRVHGRNTVIRERDAYGDYLRVVKATMDRRRAAARTINNAERKP